MFYCCAGIKHTKFRKLRARPWFALLKLQRGLRAGVFSFISNLNHAWVCYVFLTTANLSHVSRQKAIPLCLSPLFFLSSCANSDLSSETSSRGRKSSDQSEGDRKKKICGRNLHKSAWLMYSVNWRSDTVTSPSFHSDHTVQQLTLNWKLNCLAVGPGRKTNGICWCNCPWAEREIERGAGRQEACVRGGKLVNKQRRWMSLLKRPLIQAIRKQSEGVWEEEVTYVWLMALNTELNGVGQG